METSETQAAGLARKISEALPQLSTNQLQEIHDKLGAMLESYNRTEQSVQSTEPPAAVTPAEPVEPQS